MTWRTSKTYPFKRLILESSQRDSERNVRLDCRFVTMESNTRLLILYSVPWRSSGFYFVQKIIEYVAPSSHPVSTHHGSTRTPYHVVRRLCIKIFTKRHDVEPRLAERRSHRRSWLGCAGIHHETYSRHNLLRGWHGSLLIFFSDKR